MIKHWGYYIVLFKDKHFKVKLLVISPKKQFSLQRHNFRSEHWIVVEGCGEVILDDSSFLLKENHSVYIKRKQLHQLKNPLDSKLKVIEIQYGVKLKESDIERFNTRIKIKRRLITLKHGINFANIKGLLPKIFTKRQNIDFKK